MRILFLILFFPILTFSKSPAYSQVKIDIRVKQAISPKAHLYFKGIDNDILVDSASKTNNDHFAFLLPAEHNNGIYKLKIGKNINFEFMVGLEEEVALETVIYSVEDSLKSISSKENDIYIKYLKLKKKESQLSWFLESARDYYNDTSLFRMSLEKELVKLKSDFFNKALSLAKSNTDLIAAKLILLELRPQSQLNQHKIDSRSQLLGNWWLNCDLSDSSLLNFPQLEKKLWDYFDIVYNEGLDKEEQEKAFLEAAQVVLKLKGDKRIIEFFRHSLLKEFAESDYREVANYLINNNIFGSDEADTGRVEAKLIKPDYMLGQKIIDFKLSSSYSRVRISEIKAKYKLLVFWSSWCPHCIEMLPELKKIYARYQEKGLEVIAICVDDEIENCSTIISDNKLEWINENINSLQTKSLRSKFDIDETPKFYLMGEDLVIVSLPSNVRQVEAKLKKVTN